VRGGEGVRQVVSPTFHFPSPLPLSIPTKFSDKPVGGKVKSSEGGEVPRLHNNTLVSRLLCGELRLDFLADFRPISGGSYATFLVVIYQ